MTLLGHSTSNKFPTTRVAFSGRPMCKKYSVTKKKYNPSYRTLI